MAAEKPHFSGFGFNTGFGQSSGEQIQPSVDQPDSRSESSRPAHSPSSIDPITTYADSGPRRTIQVAKSSIGRTPEPPKPLKGIWRRRNAADDLNDENDEGMHGFRPVEEPDQPLPPRLNPEELHRRGEADDVIVGETLPGLGPEIDSTPSVPVSLKRTDTKPPERLTLRDAAKMYIGSRRAVQTDTPEKTDNVDSEDIKRDKGEDAMNEGLRDHGIVSAGETGLARIGDETDMAYTMPPVYHPLQRREASKIAVLQEEGLRLLTEDDKLAGIKPDEVDQLRNSVVSAADEQISSVLPPAILKSPAAQFIISEAQIRGGSFFVEGTDGIEESARDTSLPPNMRTERRNTQLHALRDEAVNRGVEKVIVNVSPLEVAERVAAALSQSNDPMAENPIVVQQFSKDGRTYVDALQVATIIETESLRGGLIPGRSDEVVEVLRQGVDPQETFRSSVGMVQDTQDPDVTLVFSVEPGYAPMPGRQANGKAQTDFGLLEISGVAVQGRRFERRMQDGLNAPMEVNAVQIGVAGLECVTEVRRRTDVVRGVKYMTDPEALGTVREDVRAPRGAHALERSYDGIEEAELID